MRQTAPQNDRIPCRGFTLAELLVVIAIIGILMAIVLPAFNSIAGSSAMDTAAGAVRSAAMLARQHAITHNQPTYLLLRDAVSTEDESLAYRSYAVYTIDTHHHPVTEADGSFLTDWSVLPEGIVFDDLEGGITNIFMVSQGAAWNGGISKHNILRIGDQTYIVQGFKPNGESGSETHWIYLAEGFYSDSGELIRTSAQGRQIRFSISGKAHLVDYTYGESIEGDAP